MTIQEKAAAIVANAQIITLASITENGYPRPVPMVKIKSEGVEVIYVVTGTSTAKTAHFRANPKGGVSVVDDQNGIVMTGNVEIVTDKSVKTELWQDWLYNHIPKGVEDPEYTLLKFTAESVTYWIDNEFVKE
ncbi:pyridoxamine 5'-phosphate oxidase family protein [Bacteroides thetaiotaomicron]|uniref:pyridoxamine 5'-phosphate oxidase family protein n=1 Tax=Bacteroides thetaiotaomicron TaxID=818 RepID=UPI0021AB8143|nr:pyridoxamine 5'-phosphate oxidase family protein [Bacteroides thetaiotaomicron]